MLLDTHVLIWMTEANSRLGASARKTIEQAFQQDRLAVSAISFWEVGTLVRKGRVHFELDIQSWRDDLIKQGVIEFPVDGEIAAKAAELAPFNTDPGDRILAATALKHSLTLVTADRKMLDCTLAIKRLDARI